jgi:hypothetical protein
VQLRLTGMLGEKLSRPVNETSPSGAGTTDGRSEVALHSLIVRFQLTRRSQCSKPVHS